MINVAFQGEFGAYSEDAIFQFFRQDVDPVACRNFDQVFKLVEEEKVKFGIVPVENSTYGFVIPVWDLFLKYNVKVYAETILRVVHCLIALPGVDISDIKYVYSHIQAIGQCKEFLNNLNVEIVPTYDTAGSVKLIKNEQLYNAAAIASRRAAEVYKMKILAKGIETDEKNYTRFFIISVDEEQKPTGKDKTTIVFSTVHKPGALYRALKGFAENNINLTSIISRPIIGKPWEYYFYIDFEGHYTEDNVKNAFEKLKENVTFFKILGSYPMAYVSYV